MESRGGGCQEDKVGVLRVKWVGGRVGVGVKGRVLG